MPVAIIFAPIFVIVASVVIVRTGAVALQMTGLDRATASFQALSAFTNCGFTTREAESVVNHPQRRRIVRALMLLGNAGDCGGSGAVFSDSGEAFQYVAGTPDSTPVGSPDDVQPGRVPADSPNGRRSEPQRALRAR